MPLLRPLSVSAQAAAHIREALLRGHWSGTIPGVYHLSAELGVNRKTIEAALRQLEHEGILEGQGQGRRRRIVLPDNPPAHPLRVGLLLYEPVDSKLDYIVELQHSLANSGHTVIPAKRSLTELKMDVTRVSRMVEETPADAWAVLAGSREVVEWFSNQPRPAFALFGRQEGLPIAAARPDKVPAFAEATRHLIQLGHSRIVLLARRDRRLPQTGLSERAFQDELKAQGIPVSDYNLPDWEETREGLQALLRSLFLVTPPTAMIIEEAPFFTAVLQFLASRGIRVPQQVSLISTDADPHFNWCTPSISHIRWDAGPLIRRIVRWAASVSQGITDTRQTTTKATFVSGGTTGPAQM